MNFYKLKVSELSNPIPEALTITFDLPSNLQDTFQYKPGQHLILKLNIGGQEVRRSYSLNSSPFMDQPLQITVKRVMYGLVSNHLNDKLKVGDELEVMAPQGKFFAEISTEAYKTYFLFAAGSGITPMLSIAKSVLTASPYSMVYLFYGNANQDTIMFKEELDNLETESDGRLKVEHILSEPKVWTTWKSWKGRKGRIDAENIEWFINEYPPIAQDTEYYCCGPGAMNICVRDTLVGLGVPKELVHIEQFGTVKQDIKTISAVADAELTISLQGETKTLNIPEGKTILQTLRDANIEVPYSCESGICGTCVARLKSGAVEMKSCMALDDGEVKKGLVLCCQALPTSESVSITFE